ncbi:MAG: TolB protein [Candidatus Binatota bacterium]|nr:TolB protein [Candidatus Binatota bacterium]
MTFPRRLAAAAALVAVAVCLSLAVAGEDAGAPGLIAYVDLEGELWVVHPDGTDPRKLTKGGPVHAISFSPTQGDQGDDFYTWPAWSPDGKRVMVFRVSQEGEQLIDGLYVFDAASSRILDVYSSPKLRPIYAYWSPDGTRLALLLQNPSGFSLSLWPSPTGEKPKSIADGVPFFFDWKKDATSLLLHVGNDPDSPAGHSVKLLLLSSGKREVISLTPATFGPPSWSADGDWMAYGRVTDKAQAQLVVANPEGGKPHSVSDISQRVAFVWSPTSPVLALATTSEQEPLYKEIRLVDARSGKSSSLATGGAIAAFFWSPKGDRILYAKRDIEKGDWVWAVVDVATRKSRDLGRFFPSRPLTMVFQYFDQYALSHRVWSPDGRAFVFSGIAEADYQQGEPWTSPRVYVMSADGKAAPRQIGNGHTAFWSPK